jgi:hypothetical protein
LRRLVLLALSIASLLGGVSTAGASALAWQGTMTLDLGRLGTLIQTGTGVAQAGGTAGGILNTLRIGGGLSIPSATLSITDAKEIISVISARSVMATLGTGTLRGFSQTGPLMWSALSLPGMVRFCFIANCNGSPTIPLFTETSSTPSRLGNGVGVGGLLTRMGTGVVITTIALQGAGWQTSVATLFTKTTSTVKASGLLHGATSQMPFTVTQGVGLLQLVTPTQVTTKGPAGNTEKIALFTTLTIEFIPEPGKMIGALTGVVAVALLAVSRRRPGNRA